MLPVDLPPPPPTGTVSVSVPGVATTASDGLARSLRPGRVRVSLPVLLTVPGESRAAWLEIGGVADSPVLLEPGRTARVSATAVVRPASTVTVRLVAAGRVIRSWEHHVGR